MDQSHVNAAATPPRHVAWFPEFLQLGQRRIRTQVRLLGLAMLVGLVAGLGAIAFYVATRAVEHGALGLLAGYDPQPRPAGESPLSWLPPVGHPLYPWLLLIIPTVGGLLSGLLVYTLAPEAEGHGTDAVIAAYHLHDGQIRPRVPLVKIVASALTLGSGGSGGREGPIAQIGAGFGSLLANLLRLRAAERRVLMAAGMGAGIAAIFRAPLAGALFAAEVLYRSPEFEAEVIMPAAIACVVSYCTLGAYSGWQPLFATPDLSFNNAWELGPYLLLVLFMVALAALYTRTFYGWVRVFRRVPLPPHFRPALGAFLTGVVALVLYFLVGAEPTGTGRALVRLQRHPERRDQRNHGQRLGAAGHRPGEDSHHGADDRQRRLGRRVRAVDGHRRLRRWRFGPADAPVVARARAPSGQFRDYGHGRLLCRGRENADLHVGHRQRK